MKVYHRFFLDLSIPKYHAMSKVHRLLHRFLRLVIRFLVQIQWILQYHYSRRSGLILIKNLLKNIKKLLKHNFKKITLF
jgi:hypothetical protein